MAAITEAPGIRREAMKQVNEKMEDDANEDDDSLLRPQPQKPRSKIRRGRTYVSASHAYKAGINEQKLRDKKAAGMKLLTLEDVIRNSPSRAEERLERGKKAKEIERLQQQEDIARAARLKRDKQIAQERKRMTNPNFNPATDEPPTFDEFLRMHNFNDVSTSSDFSQFQTPRETAGQQAASEERERIEHDVSPILPSNRQTRRSVEQRTEKFRDYKESTPFIYPPKRKSEVIGDKLAERAAEPVDDDKRNDSSLANADASNVDDSQGHIESEPSREQPPVGGPQKLVTFTVPLTPIPGNGVKPNRLAYHVDTPRPTKIPQTPPFDESAVHETLGIPKEAKVIDESEDSESGGGSEGIDNGSMQPQMSVIVASSTPPAAINRTVTISRPPDRSGTARKPQRTQPIVPDNHGASPVLGRESVKTVEDSYQEEKEMLEDSENAGENPTEPSDVNKIQQDFVEQLFQASPSNSSSYRDSSNSGLNISPKLSTENNEREPEEEMNEEEEPMEEIDHSGESSTNESHSRRVPESSTVDQEPPSHGNGPDDESDGNANADVSATWSPLLNRSNILLNCSIFTLGTPGVPDRDRLIPDSPSVDSQMSVDEPESSEKLHCLLDGGNKRKSSIYLLKPKIRSPNGTPGLRRSKRHRVPRLATHMNQRIKYRILPDGTREIAGVEDVKVTDPEMKRFRTIDAGRILEQRHRKNILDEKRRQEKLARNPRLGRRKAKRAKIRMEHHDGFNLTQSSAELDLTESDSD